MQANHLPEFMLPVASRSGASILMADRWNKDDLRDSRYVWLPLEVSGETLALRWHDAWVMSRFD